jgi:hypothetical protein
LSIRAPRWVVARHPRLRVAPALTAAVVALLAGAIGARPAHAALSATGPANPATGYPDWYQDGTGLKLQLCLDGPPFCLAARSELVAPEGEAFWFQADAAIPVGASGSARLVLAQEAAFLDTAPISFGRIRVVVGGASANTTYTFFHPYGSAQVTTDALGNGRFNEDVGCEVAPCSFGAALGSGIGPQFLRWDPTVAPAPPAGYIGDAITPHRIAGGSVRNTFGVGGGATTDLFTVQGKLAGPPVPVFQAPRGTDFGATTLGAPVTRTVTVGSFGVPDAAGRSNLAVGPVSVSGPQAAEFAITGNTCTGQVLPSGASCAVAVTFSPGALGARSASLDIGHNSAGGGSHIALGGAGAQSAAEVAALALRNRLRINRLRTTHRMSRARVLRRGLRLSMRLPADAEVLKLAVYRVRGGRVNRRPVWLGYRVVGRLGPGGLYRVRLDSRTLRRRLKAGLYQLNVTPGVSKRQLGATSTTRIRITRS